MSGWSIAYSLFAFVYVVLLPSYALGRLVFPRERLAVRFSLGMVMTLTVTSLLTFGLAMILRTNISQPLLFGVATVIMITGGLVPLLRHRRHSRELEE